MKYIPKRGDIVWLEFDPRVGKEIQKTRPAVVISPQKYNQKAGLALFLPITSQIKGYPFEVVFAEEGIKGAILCDQMRSLDWCAWHAKFITALNAELLKEVMEKFLTLLLD